MKEQIATNADTTHKKDDKEILIENFLINKYTQTHDRKNSLRQFGLRNTKQLLDKCTPASREKVITEFAVQLLRDVRQEKMPLAGMKKKTDDALKILFAFYKEKRGNISPEISIQIAKAYYLASVTILPRGITIPEKKKEALRKGAEFINRAIGLLNNTSPAQIDAASAYRIKGLLSIEQNRIDKRNCDDKTLKDILTKAVVHGCNKYDEREDDVRIAVRLCELGGAVSLTGLDNIKADDLQKAKLYYFLKKDADNTKTYMNKCIKSLKYKYLSHRLWDETVDFIERLRQDENQLWKDFALNAYEACRRQEQKTDAFRLRWYWSRQRKLYDMAFLSAKEGGDCAKMAEIIDSLKSRTSLRLSALWKIKEADDEISTYLDKIERAHQDSYVKGLAGEDETVKENEGKTPEQIDYTRVPEGWVVVHFYLNQLEGMGYAIVYDRDAGKWQYKDFSYKELFNAFITWQTNYSLYKEGAARHLVELCKETGRAMPFLFENDFIPSEKEVLFIPHDFLHRLPLHGAIKEGTNEVFLVNHACCYLPAWSFASQTTEYKTSGQFLLKNFPEYDYKKLMSSTDWTKPPIDTASADDLIKITSMREQPKLLVILCHGEADMANPFRSKLKLKNGGITHLEILKSVKGIKGAQIILGACETDMVPPLSDVMDEHTSVATALLINKARGILGAMWKVKPERIEDIVKITFAPNNYFIGILNIWQKEMMKKWIEKKCDSLVFYQSIVFRIYKPVTTE